HEVVSLVQHANVLCDDLDIIGDRDDALDVDAERAELPAEIGRVCVDHLSREDLVSDHEDAGGGHGASIRAFCGQWGTALRGPAMEVEVLFPVRGRSVRVPWGTLLIDAVRGVNLPIASACRGDVLCGRCGVAILAGRAGLDAETPDETRTKERNRI